MNRALQILLFGGQFSPLRLFRAGEQGAWYDPSDFSTMFQDSAGTTPVTAVGQPVGMILDKRLGAVRGAEAVTNGDFSNGTTGWTATGGASQTVVGGELIVTNTAGGGTEQSQQSIFTAIGGAASIGKWYELTVTARLNTSTNYQVLVETNAVNLVLLTGSSATNVPLRAIFLVPTGTTDVAVRLRAVGIGTCAFDDASVKPLAGNHATQATAASRPTLRQDASGYYYLEFDGVDDSLATGSVDFSGTSKFTTWMGATKQANDGMLLELSSTTDSNTGTFHIYSGTDAYQFLVKGTSGNGVYQPSLANPASSVIAFSIDLSSGTLETQNMPRLNGVSAQTNPTTTTTAIAASGNYPIYIGRRGGSSLPFNGRLYSLAVVGAAKDATTIARMERWVGSRMGIAL